MLSSGRIGGDAASKTKSSRQLDAEVLPILDELDVEYGPFPVALGRSEPAQARGWVARSGYGMVVRGEGEVSHVLRLASLLGLPAVKASVEGAAEMDLQIAGSWTGNVSGTASGFLLPEVTGTAQLHNLRAMVRGLNGPIEISSAQLQLTHDEARVEKLSARAADAHWTGSVALLRGCGTPGTCLVRFSLNTEELRLAELSKWLSSQPTQRRWYQMLAFLPAPPLFLETLRASGKVNAGRLLIHNLVANRVSASVDLERGKLKISDLRADLLGGKHQGDWQADFTLSPPVYAGSGTVTGISLQQMADAMHDPWIAGTAGGLIGSQQQERIPRHSGNLSTADCSSISGTECCLTFHWRVMKERCGSRAGRAAPACVTGILRSRRGNCSLPGKHMRSAAQRRWGRSWISS